jgi:hypothetical protein
MASPTWPSQVPYKGPVNGISAGPTYVAPIRSETEGGPAIMRPRPGPRSTEIGWQSKLLSHPEWQAFEQFAREVLDDGTLPFMMPVYKPDGCYVSRLCQLKDGTWQTDFSAAPRVRISFTMIVWNY